MLIHDFHLFIIFLFITSIATLSVAGVAAILYVFYKVLIRILSRVMRLPLLLSKDSESRSGYGFYSHELGPVAPTAQHDVALQEARKRVKQVFENQKEAMNARALKKHDASCADYWLCKRDPCFIPMPDKIVSKSQVKRKTIDERTDDLKYTEGKIKSKMRQLKYGMIDEKK